ncbi:hypothetical protein ACKVMT_02645 [Halobacteriales archaeon Cl-PHB]
MIDSKPERDDKTQPRPDAQDTDQPGQATDQPAQPPQNEGQLQSSTAAPEPTGDTDETGELPRDQLFDALKNGRRRQLIRYLDERGERVTLGTLAEHVAAIENDTKPELLDSDQRKRVYVGLYQCHLPRLDDMDVVDFDKGRGHVELGDAAPQVTRYLYLDDARDGPRYRYYSVFAGVGAVVLTAAAATGLLGGVAAASLLVGFVLGVAGVALLHTAESR